MHAMGANTGGQVGSVLAAQSCFDPERTWHRLMKVRVGGKVKGKIFIKRPNEKFDLSPRVLIRPGLLFSPEFVKIIRYNEHCLGGTSMKKPLVGS